jgi:hypothetical protein
MSASWNRLAEARIRQAQRAGLLSDLPGAGRSLPSDPVGDLPEAERMEAYTSRSAGGLPEEAALLRELEKLTERFEAETAVAREQLGQEISDKAVRLSILFEASGKPIAARTVLDRAARALTRALRPQGA